MWERDHMITLDCHSTDTIYASLETVLSLSRTELEALFQRVPIDEADDDLLMEHVRAQGRAVVPIERVCWFHFTRALPNPTFLKDGLVPLTQSAPKLWDRLYSLVDSQISSEVWQHFQANFSLNGSKHAQLLSAKMQTPGPYAFLIRARGFSKEEGHNYLFASESVEDICNAFREQFQIDLLAKYRRRSKRCIVKFYTTSPTPRDSVDFLGSALYYLYATFHRDVDRNVYCQFDGHGQAIPPEQILGIDWIKGQPVTYRRGRAVERFTPD